MSNISEELKAKRELTFEVIELADPKIVYRGNDKSNPPRASINAIAVAEYIERETLKARMLQIHNDVKDILKELGVGESRLIAWERDRLNTLNKQIKETL